MQPNFDFLSMFKSAEQPLNSQSTNNDFHLGFGSGNMDFNAFNAPSTTTATNNLNFKTK